MGVYLLCFLKFQVILVQFIWTQYNYQYLLNGLKPIITQNHSNRKRKPYIIATSKKRICVISENPNVSKSIQKQDSEGSQKLFSTNSIPFQDYQGPYHQGILFQDPQQPNNFWGKINKSRLARFQRKITRKFEDLSKTTLCGLTQKCINRIPVINPNNVLKILWDVLMAFIRFYLLIVIPLEISFNTKLLYNQLSESVYLCMILLVMDILINFITSFYEKGYLIMEHSRIAIHYMKSGFLFDLICILSLVIVMVQEMSESNIYIEWQYQHMRVFDNGRDFISLFGIIVQLQNIVRVFQRLQNSQDFSENMTLIIDLFKLVMFLFLLEHVFTCIWYFVGVRIDGDTWLIKMELNKSTYTEQYITAFYFTSVTMFTVGYGDVVPQNQYERLVTISFMIFSTLQLSYTVSAIWNVYSKLNERHDQHVRKMRAINTYMNYMNISTTLRYRIREYLTFYWKEQAVEENMEVKDIVTQLSQDLQENLIFEANSMIVQGCELFRDNFSHEFKGEILKLVQTTTLTPGKQLQIDEPSLFFVERGAISVRMPLSKIDLANINKGENFGLRDFIIGQQPKCNYYSKGFSKLIMLKKQDFLSLMKQFPEDLEQFCFIRDKIIFEGAFYGSLCYSCHSLQHTIELCPLINLKVDKYLQIKKLSYPATQGRNTLFKRKKQKKRAVLLKDLKPDLEQRQDTISSIESDQSSELQLKESYKANHDKYFHQNNLKIGNPLVKQIQKQQQQQQTIEINNLGNYEEEQLNTKEAEQISQLKMQIQARKDYNIDEIKNYTYYNPEYNNNFIFKTQKFNQKLIEQWNSLCYYLTFPYEFLKKYRPNILRYSSMGGMGNSRVQRMDQLPKKRKTVIMFRPPIKS